MSIILGRRHRLLHVRAILAKRIRGEQEICPVHSGSLLDSQLLHQERATPRAPLREEARGPRVLHRQTAEKEVREEMQKLCKNKFYLGIHDRFIRDEKFRKNMFDTGRTEEMCRKMDELANEDHTHHLTPEEIRGYRANWWIRSNKVRSDTMPVRHRPDFKQALSTLRQLKDQHQQRVTKLFLVLVELARILVAFFL